MTIGLSFKGTLELAKSTTIALPTTEELKREKERACERYKALDDAIKTNDAIAFVIKKLSDYVGHGVVLQEADPQKAAEHFHKWFKNVLVQMSPEQNHRWGVRGFHPGSWENPHPVAFEIVEQITWAAAKSGYSYHPELDADEVVDLYFMVEFWDELEFLQLMQWKEENPSHPYASQLPSSRREYYSSLESLREARH